MRSMAEITKIAAKRKGRVAVLERLLSRTSTPRKIRKLRDDRWLSVMTKCIFQAGFNWQMIENKWPQFEEVFEGFNEVFEGFNLDRWMMMSDNDLGRQLKTDGIVRNVAKIRSVRENATYLVTLRDDYGSVGDYFAACKSAGFCNNLRELQKNGARLAEKRARFSCSAWASMP